MHPGLELTTRQVKEIEFALTYLHRYNHGTPSHNHLALIATLAQSMGFELVDDEQGTHFMVPSYVVASDNKAS